MAMKRSEERFDKGGRVLYLVYDSDQRLRGGNVQRRKRVKRFYLPADSREVSIKGPQRTRKRTGREVNGVEVHYEHLQAGTTARRGQTTYKVPERWAQRVKVLEVPKGAGNVEVTKDPPKASRMAVA